MTQDAQTEVTSASTLYQHSHDNCAVANAELAFRWFFFFLAFAYGGRVSSAPVSRELGTDNDYKGRNVEFINDLDISLVSTNFIFEKQA